LRKSGIELAVIVLRSLIMIVATGETVHTSVNMGMLATPFAYLIILVWKTTNINCKKTENDVTFSRPDCHL